MFPVALNRKPPPRLNNHILWSSAFYSDITAMAYALDFWTSSILGDFSGANGLGP